LLRIASGPSTSVAAGEMTLRSVPIIVISSDKSDNFGAATAGKESGVREMHQGLEPVEHEQTPRSNGSATKVRR
jgi:hypothetical protein